MISTAFSNTLGVFLGNLMALEGDLGYLIAFSDFLGKKKKKKNKIDVRQESTIC
jgi:hypothetical protein